MNRRWREEGGVVDREVEKFLLSSVFFASTNDKHYVIEGQSQHRGAFILTMPSESGEVCRYNHRKKKEQPLV